jgi:RHS repeat-associated protein
MRNRVGRRRCSLLLAALLLGLLPEIAHPLHALATTDLAQGQTATASTAYSGWPASHAVDGNDSTGWSCSTVNCAAGEWLKVDLGSAQSVGSLRVYMSDALGRAAWKLQHSSDGSTWSYALANQGTSADVTMDLTHAISDRYWRLVSTTAAGANGWEVFSFSLFDTGATAPADGDLIRNLEPTGSSTSSDWFADYATDGGGTTGWSCSAINCGAGEWLQIDFGTPTTVGSVHVVTTSTGAAAFRLQHSSDGSTWIDTLQSGPQTDVTLDLRRPTSDRYWRIYSIDTAGSCGWCVYTWELFSYGAQPPSNGDFAQNMPATASTTGSGWPARQVTDGDDATGWSCSAIYCAAGEWLKVDLENSTTPIAGVRVLTYSGGNGGAAWKLQYSSDGTTWTDSGVTDPGTTIDVTKSFGARSARYWRILSTGAAGSCGWCVMTFSLLGNVSPTGGAVSASESPTGHNFCWACGARGTVGIATKFPINTATGNFFHIFNDVSIPGRSYPLQLVRTYNSQNAATDGPFGYGWQFNYNMSLSCTGTTATITQEDSGQSTFTSTGSCTSATWTPSASRTIATLSYNSGSSTWTYKRQGRDTYTFNSSGQLTAETDLNGYVTTLTYTAGKLTTITDPAGRTLTLTWTGTHITGLTDANVTPNRTVSYSYDGSGNLQDVTDVAGGDTHFAYDGSHRVTTMKDPVCEALGGSCPGVQNHYDGSGRVDWQKDQLNRETTFAYTGTPGDASGGTTTTTDPAGNVTVEGYEYGVRTYITRGSGTAQAATTEFLYDPATLVLTAVIDPNDNTMTQTVDASGNVLTTTDALNRTTTNTYNAFNEVLTTEDGNGITATNTYDGNGNLTSTSTPVSGSSCTCQVTTYTYGNGTYPGDVTSITDPDSKVSYFHYDSNGYQDQVKDPLGNVTGTVRNADGWVTAAYTPKASCTWNSSPPTGCSATYKTAYSYIIPGGSTTDEFGDVQTITDPLSHVATFGYDADRNKTSVKDGNSNTTAYTFNVANELTTTTRPDSTTQVTDYNSDGTVQDQKDGKGNTILAFGYDSLARVTTVTDALSNVTTYTHDANGNTLTKTDPGGNCATPSKCMTMTYDADNELMTVTYSDGVTPNITSVTYDSDGQRTGMSDGTGSPTWSFDNLHRLTSYTSGNGDTVSYVYNLRNEPTTITYPGSHNVTRAYDNAGRLTSVQDWLGTPNTSSFGYDANSNLTTDTFQSTAVDTYTFNAADQMTAISDVKTVTIFSATYTRDSNGQLATDNSVPATNGAYKYTALNQLCYAGTASTTACSSPPAASIAYGFDSADNLTTNNGNAQQFNNADELCWAMTGASANNCATPPAGATTYNYDTRGNQTSHVPAAGSATCTAYDQANRLTSIKTGTGSTCTSPTTVGTYAYDGGGLRQSKTVSGTTTQYLWDQSAGLPLLLDEKAGGANPIYFIYGPGGLPVEQIDASGAAHFYHHDQLGSTRAISSSLGVAENTYTYDPQGNTTASAGTVTNPLQFSGEYKDAESGLYYLRARYYDPATAQFLTLDPVVALTRSPYAYVVGNPLNGTDPSGKCGPATWVCVMVLVSLAVLIGQAVQGHDQTCDPETGSCDQIRPEPPPTPFPGAGTPVTPLSPPSSSTAPGGTTACINGRCWIKNQNECGWTSEQPSGPVLGPGKDSPGYGQWNYAPPIPGVTPPGPPALPPPAYGPPAPTGTS